MFLTADLAQSSLVFVLHMETLLELNFPCDSFSLCSVLSGNFPLNINIVIRYRIMGCKWAQVYNFCCFQCEYKQHKPLVFDTLSLNLMPRFQSPNCFSHQLKLTIETASQTVLYVLAAPSYTHHKSPFTFCLDQCLLSGSILP